MTNEITAQTKRRFYSYQSQEARCHRLLRLRNSQRGRLSTSTRDWLTREIRRANRLSLNEYWGLPEHVRWFGSLPQPEHGSRRNT